MGPQQANLLDLIGCEVEEAICYLPLCLGFGPIPTPLIPNLANLSSRESSSIANSLNEAIHLVMLCVVRLKPKSRGPKDESLIEVRI